MMKILVPALGALVLTTATTAYDQATTTTYPCEVISTTPPPTTTPPPAPAAPQNLRIIGTGGSGELAPWDEVSTSGPFADEDALNTASQAVNPHAYYEMLAQRSDCVAAYSLRNPAQLATRQNGGYSINNSRPPAVTYTYPNDPDPRQQDAAKVVIPAGLANLQNQVRLPIPTHAPQSLFVVWDGWFGREWINGGIPDQKTWQLGSPFNSIHLEIRNRYQNATKQSPGDIAMIDGRLYNGAGPNITNMGTLAPQSNTFAIRPETWTRWIAYLKPLNDGSGLYEYSLWAADPTRDPVLIFDRLQMKPSSQSLTSSWESFWLEFNTSTNNRSGTTFDLVAYVRNVVMLKGLADPRPLLQRP